MAEFFNEKQGQVLYQRILDGDSTAIQPFLEHCRPLTEVIANSLAYNGHSHLFDELVQTGLLKIYDVCRNRKYNPEQARLYSFLNTAIRNYMIDCIRREDDKAHISLDAPVRGEFSPLGELLPAPEPQERINLSEFYPVCQEYAASRFPSIHPTVAADMAEYVVSSVGEQKDRGVVHTLEVFYPINRKQASTLYQSTVIRLRLAVNRASCYPDEAIELAQTSRLEFTQVPETVLVIGKWNVEPMMTYMTGSYVHFFNV